MSCTMTWRLPRIIESIYVHAYDREYYSLSQVTPEMRSLAPLPDAATQRHAHDKRDRSVIDRTLACNCT